MTVKTTTCHIACCDDCGGEYEHDYTPHWPSADEAIDEAVCSADWWGDEKLLLCSTCRYKPHGFIPDESSVEECDRCGNPEDEHGETVAASS